MKHPYTASAIVFLVLRVLACGSKDDPSPDGAGGSSTAEGGAGGGDADGAHAGEAGSTGTAGDASSSGAGAVGGGGDSNGGTGGEAGSGGSSDCPLGDPIRHPQVCADSFTISMVCSSGPCDGQVFAHNYEVTWKGYEFSGTGESLVLGDTHTEAICGAISGDKLSFHSLETTDPAAGYTIDGTATLASDNTAEGLADVVDSDGTTQEFSIAVTTLNIGCE